MKNTALLGILAVLVLEAGCMMGPKYKRPAVNVPQKYRTPEPQQATQASSLGNEQWWQLYQDPVLTQLIHTAIAQNYDVRIAAARVLEAQAQVGITRSNQFPSDLKLRRKSASHAPTNFRPRASAPTFTANKSPR